ncbi:unnamed protein product [Ixodes hexagonus]
MSHGEVVRKGEPCESYTCDTENKIMTVQLCHYGVYQRAPPNCTLKKNPGEFPTCCPWPQCHPIPGDNQDANSVDEKREQEATLSSTPTQLTLSNPDENTDVTTESSDDVPSDVVDLSGPPTGQNTGDTAQSDAIADGNVAESSSSEEASATIASASSEGTSSGQPSELDAGASSLTSESSDQTSGATIAESSSPSDSRKERSVTRTSEEAAEDYDCHSRCDRFRSFAAGLNSSVLNCDCI